MSMGAAQRCKRCGTKIRNNRSACPSCGLDLSSIEQEMEPAATHEAAEVAAPARQAARKKPAKAICPLCMASVPDEQFVEFEGERICSSCAENMRTKAAKKGATG